MTGRALYDRYTDSIFAAMPAPVRWYNDTGQVPASPLAWPALTLGERRVWNEFARRITPKRKTVKR